MTRLIDKLFIAIGLDREEIESSSARGFLYIGIILMLGTSLAFITLIALH